MNWKDKFPKEHKYFETENGILYHGDCLDIMKQIPKESIDLVLTDPPYGYIEVDRKIGLKYKDIKEFLDWYKTRFIEIKNIMKQTSILATFCNYKTNYKIRLILNEIFKEDNFLNELVWCYGAGAYSKEIPFNPKHDTIYVYSKSNNYKFNKQSKIVKSWLQIKSIADKSGYLSVDDENRTLTPYQKPIKLIKLLVDKLSFEKNVIFDPFLGSGTTAVACEQLNRRWIGIELQKEHCKIIKERLQNVKKINKKMLDFF